MRRLDVLCGLMSILIAGSLPGCKGRSIVDFENPDVPSGKEMPPKIRERYSVDGVLILPSITTWLGENKFVVWVSAFSSERAEVEIKAASLTIDGRLIALESPFSDRPMDDFEYSADRQAFEAHTNSRPFSMKAVEDVKIAHVILTVEVRKGGKTTKSGSVEATLKPKKRTYHFPQA